MSNPIRYPRGTFRNAYAAEDRALDVEVGVKVLGGRFREDTDGEAGILRAVYASARFLEGLTKQGFTFSEEPTAPLSRAWDTLLNPLSTDLGCAWGVVTTMEARGWTWRFLTPFEAGGQYAAGLTPMGASGWNGRPDFEVLALSLPEAICRAALAAVNGASA